MKLEDAYEFESKECFWKPTWRIVPKAWDNLPDFSVVRMFDASVDWFGENEEIMDSDAADLMYDVLVEWKKYLKKRKLLRRSECATYIE